MRAEAQDELREGLFANHATRSSALDACARYSREADQPLRGALFASLEHIPTLIAEPGTERLSSKTLHVGPEEEVVIAELRGTWGRKREKTSSGRILVLAAHDESLYLVVAAKGTNFWNNIVERLFSIQYPRLTRVALRTDEMRAILEDLKLHIGAGDEEFRVREFTYRARLHDDSAMKPFESDRRWTDTGLRSAFEELSELNASLQNIRFEVNPLGRNGCSGALSRLCEYRYHGEFDAFQESILQGCANIARDRLTMLSDRQRSSASKFEARPFFIEFEGGLFASQAAKDRLREAINRIANAEPVVIHGNPYLHISFLDYTEDTSCDIYVMSEDRITVVPQTRSTSTSLERLYAHICEEFDEGILRDFDEVYATD